MRLKGIEMANVESEHLDMEGTVLRTLGVALLVVSAGCAHSVREEPPIRPTWERFRQEMQCAEAQGKVWVSQYSDECKQRSFEASLDAYEAATCVSDSDCEIMNAWPTVGPCCIAVGTDWLRRAAYLKHENPLVDACGYVDRICPSDSCEAVCVSGKCKVRGQGSLLSSSTPQSTCELGR